MANVCSCNGNNSTAARAPITPPPMAATEMGAQKDGINHTTE